MQIFLTISAWVGLSALLPKNSIFKNRYISNSSMFLIVFLMVIYIPFLNFYIGDMGRYVDVYKEMHSLPTSQMFMIFKLYEWDPLFLITQFVISRFSDSHVVYVLVNFFLLFLILYKLITKMFLPWQRMFIFFSFFCLPFFQMHVFEVLRQGYAMMLLMLGMSYWFEKKHSFKFYVCLISAYFFHDTIIIIALITYLIFLFNFKLKTLLFVWSVTAFLFLTGLNANIANISFVSELNYIETYTDTYRINRFGGETNKLDFFIFTAFFLLIALIFYKKINLDDYNKKIYLLLVKCYIGFSAMFLLFGFIAYSNRIAVYSWLLIPLIVCYPVLYKKEHSRILLFLIILAAFIGSFTFSPFIYYKF